MFAYAKPEQKQESKSAVQKKEPERTLSTPNLTGIPDTMKTRFENLSGFSFDDVRVHYNSDKPARLQALAYTQGNQVYVAPGQERHLGHELGHVVQQKQGRVRPTGTAGDTQINSDPALEREADTSAVQQSAPVRWQEQLESGSGVVAQRVAFSTADRYAKEQEYIDLLARLRTADHVENILSAQNLHYRFGGSFAAYFGSGTGRIPGDVDVELQNGADLQQAANAMHFAVNNVGGENLNATANLHENVLLNLTTSVDMVNENHPNFTATTRGPAEMGEVFAAGDLSGPTRLFVNFLNRFAFNPALGFQKQDNRQIIDVLKKCRVLKTYEAPGGMIVNYITFEGYALLMGIINAHAKNQGIGIILRAALGAILILAGIQMLPAVAPPPIPAPVPALPPPN